MGAAWTPKHNSVADSAGKVQGWEKELPWAASGLPGLMFDTHALEHRDFFKRGGQCLPATSLFYGKNLLSPLYSLLQILGRIPYLCCDCSLGVPGRSSNHLGDAEKGI